MQDAYLYLSNCVLYNVMFTLLSAVGAAFHLPAEGFVTFPLLQWRKPLEDDLEVGNGYYMDVLKRTSANSPGAVSIAECRKCLYSPP